MESAQTEWAEPGTLIAIATAAQVTACQAARRCQMCQAVSIAVREEACMADATPERDDSEDEIKRKFREALERKRAGQTGSNAARSAQDTEKVHGAHGPAENRRSFRRRTGG